MTLTARIWLEVFVVVFAAVLGAAVGTLVPRVQKHHLYLMVSFAAGALLAVTIVDIAPEVMRELGFSLTLAAAASGFILLWFIGKYIYPVCPACSASSHVGHSHVDPDRTGVLLIAAISIHCAADGLAIVAGNQTAGPIGAAILFAISYHKFP